MVGSKNSNKEVFEAEVLESSVIEEGVLKKILLREYQDEEKRMAILGPIHVLPSDIVNIIAPSVR